MKQSFVPNRVKRFTIIYETSLDRDVLLMMMHIFKGEMVTLRNPSCHPLTTKQRRTETLLIVTAMT